MIVPLALAVLTFGLVQSTPPALAPPDASWKHVTSNDGSWSVHWRVVIDGAAVDLPLVRKRFTLEVRAVSLRDPALPLRGMLIDAQMPEHGHGMNVAPMVTIAAAGSGSAEGMLFHMSGRWEVDVDLDDGITVERAQWNIVLP